MCEIFRLLENLEILRIVQIYVKFKVVLSSVVGRKRW